MASGGPLNCCKILCCVWIVFVNILSIILGFLFAVIGVLILWGSSLVQTLFTISPGDGGSANQTVAKAALGGHVDVENYYSSLAALSGSAAGLLIGFGLIIVVVSCIGCFGACIGVPACLIIYMVCVSLLFIGQVIVIAIWFANSNLFKFSIRDTLEKQVQKFQGDQTSDLESASLRMIQVMFGCCGIDNGTDFQVSSPDWNRTYSMQDKNNRTITFNLTYPVSCCKYNLSTYNLIEPYCPYNGSSDATVSNYHIGCYEKVWDTVYTRWQLNKFFYSLCGCLGIEILLVIGALIICHAKRQKQRELAGGHGEVEYKMVQQKI